MKKYQVKKFDDWKQEITKDKTFKTWQEAETYCQKKNQQSGVIYDGRYNYTWDEIEE